MKRIVLVFFEDGTEAWVDDMQTLVRYVTAFRVQQSVRAMAADTAFDWAAHAKALRERSAARFEKKATTIANRRKPRGKGKAVTPETSRETLESIVADLGTKWGASSKAAKKLGISKRTLNRRTKKTAP